MRILIHGACGKMGRALRALAGRQPDVEIAGLVDACAAEDGVLTSLDAFSGDFDLLVDFSHHSATEALCAFAEARRKPLVIATTGQTDREAARIARAAEAVPVFCSGNMSLGIALLVHLAQETAKCFPDADIEIVEQHHNQKLDVPSGTALMLGRAIQEVRPEATLLTGRHENGRRTKEEIGIHALRLGSTVGIHAVIVHTGTQVLTLKHEALDRSLFAEGALAAARFLLGRAPGLYNMNHIVSEG